MDLRLLLSSNYLYSIALALFGVYCLTVALYRLFFSPLHSVPGPWYAAISDFWLVTHVLRLRRCRAINDLLHKYGPIVRVAPNKVIFLDAPTMKTVYGVSSKLSKSIFYKSLLTNGNDHAMTILEHNPHLLRKRGYASHYNPANLALFQPEIHHYVNELVSLLSTSGSKSQMPFDTLLLLRHLLIDINCAHIFGYDAGSLKAWSRHILQGGLPDELSRAISDFPKRGLMRSALPDWLWRLLERIPIHRWSIFCDSSALLGRFAIARLNEIQAALHTEKIDDNEGAKKPLIMRLLRHRYSEHEAIPEKDVVSECLGHLIAGTDTTSTTLSYLLWELSRRRDIMLHLQEELDECMSDPNCIPDVQDLQNLPYLAAIIKEGLRVYSPAPSPLERVVPLIPNSDITLLGYTMSPGTIVGSQAFSSHRHPAIFFSPDLFLPDRWLLDSRFSSSDPSSASNADGMSYSQYQYIRTPQLSTSLPVLSDAEKSKTVTSRLSTSTDQIQMATHMFPFGYGPRVCGGQNMAYIMLRIILAAIARNFDVVAPPETNERSMEMKDAFVAFPAALKCRLIFVPRQR